MNYNVYVHQNKDAGKPADLLRVIKESTNYTQEGGNIASHLDGIDTKLGENELAITNVVEGGFVQQEIENLFGTEALSIGVAYDTVNDSFERVGAGQGEPTGELIDMSAHPVFSQLTRSVVSDDGNVHKDVSWLDFTKHVDGSDVALDGSNGQVMVRFMDTDMGVGPRYYHAEVIGGKYVFMLSHFPLDGKDGRQFQMHPLFTGMSKVYMGAYELVNYDSKGWSVPYSPADGTSEAYPVTTRSGPWGHAGLTTTATDALCAARGSGWQNVDLLTELYYRQLLIVGYASYDIPGIVGDGRINQSGGDWVNGEYIGAQHFDLAGGYASAVQNGADTYDTDYSQVFGVYNPWGNVWTRVSSLVSDRVVYYMPSAGTPSYNYGATAGWTRLLDTSGAGITLPDNNGYAGAPHSGLGIVLPSDITGSSSTKMRDYYYYSSGLRVLLVGGYSVNGSNAGPFYWHASHAASSTYSSLGGRLGFKKA